MPSVLTLTAFMLREEGGGGLIREGGLLKLSTSRRRTYSERGGLIRDPGGGAY